jgi:nitrogen fixation protein
MSDIIDINVEQTVEDVTINVVDNVIQVNINNVSGGGGAVDSVNGQTGVVVLDQDDILDGTTYKQYSLTEKNKLAGIAEGAEVNVNADWNAVSGDAQILNKPTIPDVSTLVPYTGASQNVDLGEYELKSGQLTLDTTPTGTAAVATTRWNDAIGSSETTLKGGSVILKNGIDLVARVVNKVNPNTTLTKANYQVVRISGAQGQRLAVDLAQANNDNNSADTLGIVTETIATNQEGFIMTVGQLEGINTTGSLQGETWADGDVLYLSPTTAGAITNIKPTGATGHIVILGYVEYAHANNGKIYVKIMNGWELDELHNVFIDTPLNNQLLSYETATSLWKNKSIGTILGYTPYKFVDTTQVTYLGSVIGLTETIVSQTTILGNTLTDEDLIKKIFRITKGTTLGNVNIRLKVNTSNTLVGATQIGLFTLTTSYKNALMYRHINLYNGNAYCYNGTANIVSDIIGTNATPTTFTYDTTADLYVFFTVQLANVADSFTFQLAYISN